jgi:hypothetical protein
MWLRLIFISLWMTAAIPAQSPAAPITVIGEFASHRSAADPTGGYTVQLWRQGDVVFGFLSVEALSGDGPIGRLTNVKFEERSGKLSFEANLTIGMCILADNTQQPSKDLLRFRGTLVKDILSGTLTHSDLLDRVGGETATRVRLQKQAPHSPMEFKTYADWLAEADKIAPPLTPGHD